MSKTILTPSERAARITRRAQARAAVIEKRDAFREWRQQRAKDAQVRIAARAKVLRDQPRGRDRVPAHLHGLAVTVEPYTVGKRGTVLAGPDDLAPAGNHATRRARGQRGHQPRTRRRDMPGAQARRVERSRKAWTA